MSFIIASVVIFTQRHSPSAGEIGIVRLVDIVHGLRKRLLERRIRAVERRILEQQRERTLADDIIAYHRGQIAELQKRRALWS